MSEISLSDEEFRKDPYPTYERLRDAGPVHFDEERQEFFVTRYAECVQVLVDVKTFSGDSLAGFEPTLVGRDGEGHRSLRGLMQDAMVREEHESFVVQLEKNLTKSFKARRRKDFDVVIDLAGIGAGTLFENFVGKPERDTRRVMTWMNALTSTSRHGLAEGEIFVEGTGDITELTKEIRKRIERAIRVPSQSRMMTILVEHYKSGGMNERQFEDVALLITLASNETVMSTTAFCGYFLATMPDVQAALRVQPELIPRFVDEVLRFDPPVQRRPRRATVDATIAGTRIPEGTVVNVLLGSANRDEREFERPNEFRLDRASNRHLAFGTGAHLCMGRRFGQATLQLEMRKLLESTVSFTLATPEVSLAHPTNIAIRGPRSVPLDVVWAKK